VNQNHGQPLGANRFRLPVTMAEHAAAVGRINLNRLRDSGKAESWAWKEIANNGLQVAA
jgi:hypothetical protein